MLWVIFMVYNMPRALHSHTLPAPPSPFHIFFSARIKLRNMTITPKAVHAAAGSFCLEYHGPVHNL